MISALVKGRIGRTGRARRPGDGRPRGLRRLAPFADGRRAAAGKAAPAWEAEDSYYRDERGEIHVLL